MQEIKYVRGKQERSVSLSVNLSSDSNFFHHKLFFIPWISLFQAIKLISSSNISTNSRTIIFNLASIYHLCDFFVFV